MRKEGVNMAQSKTVMAFRKRMKSYGYKDIEIIKIRGYLDIYKVRATEPLGKQPITVKLTSTEMHNKFR